MVNSVRILNQFCAQWNQNLQIAARSNLHDPANVWLRVTLTYRELGAYRLDYGDSTSSEWAHEGLAHSLQDQSIQPVKGGRTFHQSVLLWRGFGCMASHQVSERDVEVREAYQEDWGGELPVTQQSDSYYLCMSGNSDESSTNKDKGEW
jgi:hypothetical protein